MGVFEMIASREPVENGWSGDKKYRAVCENGDAYLLRISPAERMEQRRALWDVLQAVQRLDISMSRTLEVGECPEGVYMVQEWIDGPDAEQAIPELSAQRQYALGVDAGVMLKKLHTIPAPDAQEPWGERFRRKAFHKIDTYRKNPLKFEGDEAMIAYIMENVGLLDGRPQSFQHGDYHIGNMMLSGERLVIIDFDRFDYGDPWEEFNRIVWCAQASPRFASGMVDGYFDGNVPEKFWRLLALYISSNTLSSIYWAIPFGQKEIDVMLKQAAEVLAWYDGMKNIVPSWYMC